MTRVDLPIRSTQVSWFSMRYTQRYDSPADLKRELDSVTAEVSQILRDVAPRSKFNLESRTGWDDLLDATYADWMTRRVSPDTIALLRRSCAKWAAAYHALRFTACTRPVWNT